MHTHRRIHLRVEVVTWPRSRSLKAHWKGPAEASALVLPSECPQWYLPLRTDVEQQLSLSQELFSVSVSTCGELLRFGFGDPTRKHWQRFRLEWLHLIQHSPVHQQNSFRRCPLRTFIPFFAPELRTVSRFSPSLCEAAGLVQSSKMLWSQAECLCL